jgi:glycosyl transferase family 87
VSDSPVSPAPKQSEPCPLDPPALWQVLLFGAMVVAYWAVNASKLRDMWHEDLPVYAHAVGAWLTGGNPYDAAIAPLYFLYPPAFLMIAGLLSYLAPPHWGEGMYTALHVAATCGIPLVLARWFFRQSWLSATFALLLFFASPRFTGILALATFNIASTAYCLAFLAAVPGLTRGKWRWFYVAVFLAATIKITFLALLMLPVLAGKRQWRNSILCGLAVVAANAMEMVSMPALYAGYRWSLLQGIVKEGAYGYGIFGMVSAYGYKLGIPIPAGAYVAALMLDLAVLVVLLLLRSRVQRPELQGVWLALVVTAIILVNPRELQYDVDISLFSAFVLWVYALRTRRLLTLMVVLFLPTFVVPFFVKALHQQGLYGTIETLIAFGLACWRLWRETETVQPEGVAAVPIIEMPETAGEVSDSVVNAGLFRWRPALRTITYSLRRLA